MMKKERKKKRYGIQRADLFFLGTGDAPSFLGLPGPRLGTPPANPPPRGCGVGAVASGEGKPIGVVGSDVDAAAVVDVEGPEEERAISPGSADDDDDDVVVVGCCCECWGMLSLLSGLFMSSLFLFHRRRRREEVLPRHRRPLVFLYLSFLLSRVFTMFRSGDNHG